MGKGYYVSKDEITNDSLDAIEEEVMSTDNYGTENKLITSCFMEFKDNTNENIVAMKIALIDFTNSTNLSRHKSKISIAELARIISKIKDIDKRIEDGDPEVVTEIAKCNGKINLFSFASKYCCYHNKNLYKKDDYSIFDGVLKKYLPLYFPDITSSKIDDFREKYDYKAYNDFITMKLNVLGITTEFRKRKFDYFVWFKNKDKLRELAKNSKAN